LALVKISQKSLMAQSTLSAAQVEPTLTELGIPLDKKEGDELHLEITPNRPDWLSVEGVARSCLSYKTSQAKKYASKKSKISISVDSSVKAIRPFFAGAYATNVRLNGESLQSLIQLQEKLHDTLGRNRKKLAIGIHDAKNIHSPFTYKAVSPKEISFTALGDSSPKNCAQILSTHEKGKKYSHLVPSKCPIILDKTNQVLSFPPIINGELTKVTTSTKEIFIDCTGTHESAVLVAASIIAAALCDLGAQIHQIQINKKECEIFQMRKTKFDLTKVNSLLGTDLTLAQAKKHLARMGHILEGNTVLSPAFRSDIIHPVDLTEDIAISIGYNNFSPQLCDFATIGKKQEVGALHESCLGLGFFEVSSWILTNQKVLENSMVDMGGSIRVKNPLTLDFTTLRPALYPNLLEIFSNSKSQPMPQNLYELGAVINSKAGVHIQEKHLCLACANPKSGYAQMNSILKALSDSLGVQYSLIQADIDGFIPGRCSKILIDSKEIGILGEIHPEVLESFSIEQPVSLFELDSKYILG